MSDLRSILLEARQLAGMSQRQLAIATGASRQTLNAMECGRKAVNIKYLQRAAAAAGCELVVSIRRQDGST